MKQLSGFILTVLVVFQQMAIASEKVKLADLTRTKDLREKSEEVRTLELPKFDTNENWKKTECQHKSNSYGSAVNQNGKMVQRPGQSPIDENQEQCVGASYEIH